MCLGAIVANALACQLPDMGSDFKVKGAMNSFLMGDGRYNFTVYSGDKDYGYVIEDVWLSNNMGDGSPSTRNRETLVWYSPDGKKLATFQRVSQERSWFGWMMGSEPPGYKDFSQGILVEGCEDSGSLYFIGYQDNVDNFLFGAWSHRNPGHYRVFDFNDVGGESMTMAVTNESNVHAGGASKYELEVMEDTVELTGNCKDKDPEFCFKLAARGMCKANYMPSSYAFIGKRDKCEANDFTVADCCSLSCSKDLPKCLSNEILGDTPVASLKLDGDGSEPSSTDDLWTIHVESTSGPGTDPRVLIALATMKTAGEQDCDWLGSNCDEESYGTNFRTHIWLGGSGGGFIAAFCAFVCICNILQRRKQTELPS